MSNDTQTLTLTDFLLARLDDYERAIAEVTGTHFDAPMSATEMWADLEAKRRIVGYRQGFEHPETRADEVLFPALGVPLDRVLKALASVYADHPDYRGEWRP